MKVTGISDGTEVGKSLTEGVIEGFEEGSVDTDGSVETEGGNEGKLVGH